MRKILSTAAAAALALSLAACSTEPAPAPAPRKVTYEIESVQISRDPLDGRLVSGTMDPVGFIDLIDGTGRTRREVDVYFPATREFSMAPASRAEIVATSAVSGRIKCRILVDGHLVVERRYEADRLPAVACSYTLPMPRGSTG